ncbi:MAG TPA: preprotein translocase subunit YajC [Verrucomicrobiae bacterium]|jgi:preprotein translocase subunit YajC|nr:preprotein translocase subunit YajC [Verrucomicrobiae bacterium]
MFISPAYAQAAGGGAPGFDPMFLIMMGLMLAVMYFLMIRPQQKKVKEHKALIAAIKRGDQVVTSGGIIGTVAKVRSDTEIELEIADGVRVRIMRGTITEILAKTGHLSKTVAADDEEEVAESTAKK